jgi:protein-disulfide isomerase
MHTRSAASSRSLAVPSRSLAILIAGAVAFVVALGSCAGALAAVAAETPLERAVAGLPQHGPWLGRPEAPVAIELYADLQCPYCAAFAQRTLPRIVSRWVADGTVRIRYRFVTWLGRDSVRTARYAIAAGRSGLLWQTTARLLASQGAEASGYATDDFLRAVGAAVPGLDGDATLTAARAPATLDPLRATRRSARLLGVDGVPALAIGRRGRPLRRFDGNRERLGQLAAAIAAAQRSR